MEKCSAQSFNPSC